MAAAPNFDRIARSYRWLEYLTFGPWLQQCRTHFLPELAACRSALVLGDGDGRFLARLLRANTAIYADAVDTSPVMLHLLTRRGEACTQHACTQHACTQHACTQHSTTHPRVRTHHIDALQFNPTCRYDLVATHFFLDCLTQSQLETLCARLTPHLDSRALWLFSDFAIPDGPMHWPARAVIRLLYLAFRLLTGMRVTRLPDHARALTAAGLTRIARRTSLFGLLTTELWQLRGAGNVSY